MPSDLAADGSAASEAGPAVRTNRELALRVASAAVLAPAGLWAVHVGGLALALATGLCAMIASAEWTRMAAGAPSAPWRVMIHCVLAVGAAAAVYAGHHSLQLVAMVGLAASGAAAGVTHLARGSVPSMAFGALYTSVPFGAFVWIRGDAIDGRDILLALLAIVWTTDIAAYFAGRGFGGPLLSPKDSPNKTWTGAIGALVCACLTGAALGRVWSGDLLAWVGFALFISIIAQGGDLLESRFKRMYGVKDTSGVVPGHGGVLDRLDALMAGAVATALVMQFARGTLPPFGAAS